MLCEKCGVHLTVMIGPSPEASEHNFCDSCHADVEAEHLSRLNDQINKPLPTDVENITAAEYLEAYANAARNGADKPAFEHIHKETLRRRIGDSGPDPRWNVIEVAKKNVLKPRKRESGSR